MNSAQTSQPQTEAGRRLLALDDFETACLDGEAMSAIILAIEAEAQRLTVERLRAELPEWFPCRCDDGYRLRDLEDPDCPAHDIDRWLAEYEREAGAASPAALDVLTVAKVLARLDPDHALAPGEITWLTAERFAAEYARLAQQDGTEVTV